jgi:hypothetical protein
MLLTEHLSHPSVRKLAVVAVTVQQDADVGL